MTASAQEPTVYQGQFGDFTIDDRDRQGVVIYRVALAIAALSFALGTGLVFWNASAPSVWTAISVLYGVFAIGLGIALWTIHIYLRPLHRTLQVFWGIGVIASLATAIAHAPLPLAAATYQHPSTIWGIGFIFAALTGLFVKEAFCFNRFETKILTPIVPTLLLGHLFGVLPLGLEIGLLAAWASLFAIFAVRKCIQAIPPDIGDKSVFAYLKAQRNGNSASSVQES